MYFPNVTIADPKYLNSGILLLVSPAGRRMVRHAMCTNYMNSKWYQMRTGPRMLFMKGDWDEQYDGRTLMFIETGGDVQEFVKTLLHDANRTDSELHELFGKED